MAEPTVAAGIARGLLQLAVSKGASRDLLLARSAINPQTLADQDNRVPFANYVALMRVGKELTGDPALALHFGEAFDMAQLSIVGLIGDACESGAEAMAQINRYARLVIEVDLGGADRFQLQRERGNLFMVDTRKNPNEFPELTESTFARVFATSRRALGEMRFVKAVHVTHAPPCYRAEYERIFQVPVNFDADKNALAIDPAIMADKTPLPSRYIFGILSERADALLQSLEGSKSTRGRVESLLMPILHMGACSMDMIANKLGFNRQALYRKLKAEGVTFERILDELRNKLALDYLAAGKVSVNETAYLVGFSDPAAFSRAFKRWTGKNPREARSPMG
jgi:AraC-like DNA-binding protein